MRRERSGSARAGSGKVVGLLRQLAKAQATALQGGLDGREVAAHDVRDFLHGIAEHVPQDHRAALAHRQAHEGAQAGRHDLAIAHGVDGVGDHLQVFVGTRGVMTCPAPQEVQRRVVGDAKQPASGIGERFGLRLRLDGLQEGFLDHVLPVDHRAGHAGAVAVQLGPQLGEQTLEIPAR